MFQFYPSKYKQQRKLSNLFAKSFVKIQSDQCKLKGKYSKKVDTFVSDTKERLFEERLFKTQLQDNLSNSYKLFDQENLNTQLAKYYTFIFSIQRVPDYVKNQLFLTYTSKTGKSYQSNDILKISQQLVNECAWQALYSSIKYGNTYAQSAIKKLQKNIIAQGGFNKFIYKFRDFFFLGAPVTKQNQITFQQFQMFMQRLKAYGTLLIDCYHIQKCGSKQLINGRVYYQLLSSPTFKFTFVNGGVVIFRLINNQLVMIPQQIFNIQYMKKFAIQQQTLMNSRIVGIWNTYTLGSKNQIQTQQQRTKFYKNFIKQN